jgi:hypothetical protein
MPFTNHLSQKQLIKIYCTHATNFTQQHHGKVWKYVLLPRDAVQVNMIFDTLVQRFEYRV